MVEAAGDAIPWIELFLAAVHTQATDAVARARGIIELRERYRRAAAAVGTQNALALVELICENAIVTTRSIEDRLGVSRPTALRLLKRMEEQGVLSEGVAGARRQRRHVAHEMMEAVAGDGRGLQHG
jgi:DNA-binding MarR family transcriptional regulator